MDQVTKEHAVAELVYSPTRSSRVQCIRLLLLVVPQMASTAAHPFVTLRNGVRMPAIGLGTYQVKGEVCKSSVRHALSAGYRHIDTAAVYKNEGDVGVAIRESGISREEIFITSKLQPSDHGVGAYEAGLAALKRLNIEYLDCELCLDKLAPSVRYRHALVFIFGLLRHSQPAPGYCRLSDPLAWRRRHVSG